MVELTIYCCPLVGVSEVSAGRAAQVKEYPLVGSLTVSKVVVRKVWALWVVSDRLEGLFLP